VAGEQSEVTADVAGTTRDSLRALLSAYSRSSPPASIAVVGNAPMSPSEERAAAIDGCDLVIRMTSFAVDEPAGPPALGRRTDVVVLHRGVVASPHTFARYPQRLYLLAEPGRMHWEPETLPDWWPADLGMVPISNEAFVRPLIRLLGFGADDAAWATTGTLMVYLCLDLFPDAQVTFTGVSIIDNPVQTTFAHAWGEPVKVTAEHKLAAEAALLAGWAEDGRIRLR
jgi:hypothetical protein